ncbi:MAG: transposase [Alphaproteobacteria bacterium]|nr:transposase [Alphaproteobacteria bacterium]
MNIFSYESAHRIGDQNVLRKVDALLDWASISALLTRGMKRSGLGPHGYEPGAAIVDATLIETAARPRTYVEAPAEDRAEDATPDESATISFSADDDARWLKKGRKSMLGYKGFARADEEGFVDKVHVTPANVGESPQFGTMIEGASTQRVLADKAYASKANRAALKGKHRDGILRKAARGRPLRASEKRFNRLISKRRFRVEQVFGTMKRLFGRVKVHAQMVMAAISQNLLKAANKITLNKQTSAIA